MPAKMSVDYATQMDEVKTHLKARTPFMWVKTHEENRFLEELNDVVDGTDEKIKRDIFTWTRIQGIVELPDSPPHTLVTGSGEFAKTDRIERAFQAIAETSRTNTIFVLKDMHIFFAPPIPRLMKDIKTILKKKKNSVVILAPVVAHGTSGKVDGLPPHIEKEIVVIDYDLPTADEIRVKLTANFEKLRMVYKNKDNIPNPENKEEMDDIVNACRGLTMEEIFSSISTSIAYLKRIDVEKILLNKRNLVKKSNIMEFVETNTTMDDIGGLDQLKEFMLRYKNMHSTEAKEFGVSPLKGLLFTGIAGCGKSLTAKVSGKVWNEPVLALDIGKVMGGIVGLSEERMRQAIKTAEALAPCVVFLDEVEKSLSGTSSSGKTDGGTLSRVFGTLLTAMEEGMKDVTVIATANNIEALPPEFLRRFNEIFFVDLPNEDERWEIFGIHLGKKGRDIARF